MNDFLLGVGSASTLILAVIALLKWRRNRINIIVDIKRMPLIIPSELSNCLIDFYESRPFGNWNINIEHEQDNKKENFTKTIENAIKVSQKYNYLLASLHLALIEIHNRGNEEINGIELKVDHVESIEIEKDGSWLEQKIDAGKVSLRPNESIFFRVWQTYPSARIRVYQAKGHPLIKDHDLI